MKSGKGGLLFLAMGGMELTWLYAWAAFLTNSILGRSFPFPEAIGTFALASALTRFSTGKGWRVVSILGVQITGFVLAAFQIVYSCQSGSSSFFSQAWLADFFNTTRSPLDWLYLILILLIAFFFWIGA